MKIDFKFKIGDILFNPQIESAIETLLVIGIVNDQYKTKCLKTRCFKTRRTIHNYVNDILLLDRNTIDSTCVLDDTYKLKLLINKI